MSQLNMKISSSKSISSSFPFPLHKNDVLGWNVCSNFALIKGMLVTIVDVEGIEIIGTIQVGVTKIWACCSVEDTSTWEISSWKVERSEKDGKLSNDGSTNVCSKLDGANGCSVSEEDRQLPLLLSFLDQFIQSFTHLVELPW